MGFNMGSKMVDEFLAINQSNPCFTFKEVATKLTEAMKYFFGVDSKVKMYHKGDKIFSLIFSKNPLSINVSIPQKYEALSYSIIYCGMIRGALESINMRVKVELMKDPMNFGEAEHKEYEIKVTLEQFIKKPLTDFDQ